MHYVVVSYDITDDTRRRRVAAVAEDYGERVQYSVFDCLLDDRALIRLQVDLEREIDPVVDSVRIYRLCRGCRGMIDILGRGRYFEEEDVRVV